MEKIEGEADRVSVSNNIARRIESSSKGNGKQNEMGKRSKK